MGKYPRPSHPPPPPPPTHKSSLQNSPSSEYVSPPLPPKPLRRNSSKATLDKEEFLKHIAVPPPAQPPPPIDYLQTGNNNVRLKSSPKNTSATPLTVGHSCASISYDIDRGKMLEQIKQGVRLKPVSERLQVCCCSRINMLESEAVKIILNSSFFHFLRLFFIRNIL